jgi:fluoride exporter
MNSVCVILGGGLGAWMRYLIHQSFPIKSGASFPWATLIVNLSGAFLIGLLMTVLSGPFESRPGWRLFLIVGILGGYTTFSALAWEGYQLFSTGSSGLGSLYLLGTGVGGTVAVVAGVWAGRLVQ